MLHSHDQLGNFAITDAPQGHGNGYDWENGKSRNAVAAEEEGKFPASEIAKRLKLPSAKLVKDNIVPAEWHHTSGHFNKTNYYDLEECEEFFASEQGQELIAEERKRKKEAELKVYHNAVVEIVEFYYDDKKWKPDIRRFYNVTIETKGGSDYCRYYVDGRSYEVRYEFGEIESIKRWPGGSKFNQRKKMSSRNFSMWTGDQAAEMIDEMKKEHRRRRAAARRTAKKLEEQRRKEEEQRKREEAERQAEEERKAEALEQLREKMFGASDDEAIAHWIDAGCPHPAPMTIHMMKKESGMSWREFEDYARKRTENA